MTNSPIPDYSQSRAVLVGTWDYIALPPVPAVEHSFRRMARLLTSNLCGWPATRVTCLDNLRQPADLPHRLIELFDDAEDVALFYYVGHGQADSRGRLCLGLAETRTEAKFRASTSLKFEDVREALHHSNARTKIVLLDCCFAGLATKPEAALGAIDVADRAACEGAYTIAASAEYDVARYEQHNNELIDLPQTFFTKFFADIIQGGIADQGRTLNLESIFRQMVTAMRSSQLSQPTQANRGSAATFPFARNVAAPRWKSVAEQAMLRDDLNSILANLSRRSQALAERQLAIIERLEQDEHDPDQLASLFELDHLVTRMRRNSESLLVLSGAGLSHQLSRSVPASEVVGAAVSEIEHYARIEVVSAPDVTVQGRAVSDLVHLIAELLDNATFFSDPEKKVTVRMAMTRKSELAIQITDQGVGMSEEDIDAANTRLADPPDLDAAVTRRMGLYVVARLAKRHNIIVRLRDNEDIEGGLIARIAVPAELVEKTDDKLRNQPTDLIGSSSISMLATPPTSGWEDPPTRRLPIYEAVSQWFESVNAGSGEQPEEPRAAAAFPAEDIEQSPEVTSWFAPVSAPNPHRHKAKDAAFGGDLWTVQPSQQRSAEEARIRMSNLQLSLLRARQEIMATRAAENSNIDEKARDTPT